MSAPLLDTTQLGKVAHETGSPGGTPIVFEVGTKVTVGSQANKRMLAWIGNLNGGSITNAQLDTSSGAVFTSVGRIGTSGFGAIELWYLDGVAAGDHTVCVTAQFGGFAGIAILEPWYDVDLSIPPSWSAAAAQSLDVACSATQAVSCCVGCYAGETPTCTDGTLSAQFADTTGDVFDQLLTARKLGASPTASFAFTGADGGNIAAAVLNGAAPAGGGSLIGGALTRGALVGGSLVARRKYHKHSSGLFLSDRSIHVSR